MTEAIFHGRGCPGGHGRHPEEARDRDENEEYVQQEAREEDLLIVHGTYNREDIRASCSPTHEPVEAASLFLVEHC